MRFEVVIDSTFLTRDARRLRAQGKRDWRGRS